jgi:hypothetical protein
MTNEINFIPVDEWCVSKDKGGNIYYNIPKEDQIFRETKGAIIIPISINNEEDINYFMTSPKRCYNNDRIHNHIIHYLNYFEKFYDPERELIKFYENFKLSLDQMNGWGKLVRLVKKFLLDGSLREKIRKMNNDNYKFSLTDGYSGYTKDELLILMESSLISKMMIPIITHYLYSNKYDRMVTQIIVNIFRNTLYPNESIMNKILDNVIQVFESNKMKYCPNIKEYHKLTHIIDTIHNIIVQIIPKYTYDRDIIGINNLVTEQNMVYKFTIPKISD